MNTLTFLLSAVIELYTMVLCARVDAVGPLTLQPLSPRFTGGANYAAHHRTAASYYPTPMGPIDLASCWWRLFIALLRR